MFLVKNKEKKIKTEQVQKLRWRSVHWGYRNNTNKSKSLFNE